MYQLTEKGKKATVYTSKGRIELKSASQADLKHVYDLGHPDLIEFVETKKADANPKSNGEGK